MPEHHLAQVEQPSKNYKPDGRLSAIRVILNFQHIPHRDVNPEKEHIAGPEAYLPQEVALKLLQCSVFPLIILKGTVCKIFVPSAGCEVLGQINVVTSNCRPTNQAPCREQFKTPKNGNGKN